MRIVAGLAMIASFAVLRRVALNHIFAAWRAVDRAAWSEAVRGPARRRMPFKAFLWSWVVGRYETAWLWQTPAWMSDSPRARRWLRILRWSPLLFFGGYLMIVSSLT